jgi:hypothetical protein
MRRILFNLFVFFAFWGAVMVTFSGKASKAAPDECPSGLCSTMLPDCGGGPTLCARIYCVNGTVYECTTPAIT